MRDKVTRIMPLVCGLATGIAAAWVIGERLLDTFRLMFLPWVEKTFF